MVKVPPDVESAKFKFSIRQPFEWKLFKDWEMLGLGILFIGTVVFGLIAFIWTTIDAGDVDREMLATLILGLFFLWWGWGNYWLFKRTHNRYYLKITAMSLHFRRSNELVEWTERTLSSRGMRFDRKSVRPRIVLGQGIKPVFNYTFPDFPFDLSLVDHIWYPVICIGPITKENLDAIKELMAYITNALEDDRQKAIELSEEKYEEIGKALTRLWSS